MKKSILFLIIISFLSVNIFGADVSGFAVDAETGDSISGIDILLTYPEGGVAASVTTESDGSFTFTNIPDGNYGLEFYSYPDPVIINGDYLLRTIYDGEITVNGEDVSGIEFNIPPHHPNYVLSGHLYDAVTNEIITVQDFQVRLQLEYYIEFFYDNATENGMYSIENLPNSNYELIVFDNEYYEGVTTDITIDIVGNDTIIMDFYLQPKSGATVTGVLLDSTTNEPIMQAGRSVILRSSTSLFTQTNSQGEFTFINVPEGIYAAIEITSQDTSYVNCSGSEITGFTVPEEGVDGVELYQKQWISIHEVTGDEVTFEPGETKTIKFYIKNDDLSYGSIWGVNLIFPDGVTVLNTGPFYSDDNNGIIFEQKPDCGTNNIITWEGWHWIGIPPYASSDGNLDVLNESAIADVTLEFADSASMESIPILYQIYYNIHCFSIQPFSYGTVMMQNENTLGLEENISSLNTIGVFPNPATDKVSFSLNLNKERKGRISLYDFSGREVLTLNNRIFKKDNMEITINTNKLETGVYYYNFISNDIRLGGKLLISR